MGLKKISVLTAQFSTESDLKSHGSALNWNEQRTGVTLHHTSAWAISGYPGYGCISLRVSPPELQSGRSRLLRKFNRMRKKIKTIHIRKFGGRMQ